ncbi:hypothetical protein DFAR_1540060 [Desulfarculales bacterium]
MFVVLLTYTKPLDKMDEHLQIHRAWLGGGSTRPGSSSPRAGKCRPRAE